MADNEQMTKTSFRLSEDEKKALEDFAKANDLTVSQVIRRACREYLTMSKIADELNKIPN